MMLFCFSHMFSSWSEVGFSGEPAYNKTFPNQESTITPSGSTVYIHDSLFSVKRTTGSSGSHGGAIAYSNTNGQILVEMSTFNDCTNSVGRGAAIYASCKDCIINKCCGYMCYCSGSWTGQFLYTSLSSTSSKNEIYDSSISHSMESKEDESYEAALYPYKGKIIISTVNLSNNVCQVDSALYCVPSFSSSSFEDPSCSVSYCSINSNHATSARIIYFERTGYYYSLTHSNIINNIDDGSDEG